VSFMPKPTRPPPPGPAISPALLAARFVYICRGAAASSLAPFTRGLSPLWRAARKFFGFGSAQEWKSCLWTA
jgi:hypothetical protein